MKNLKALIAVISFVLVFFYVQSEEKKFTHANVDAVSTANHITSPDTLNYTNNAKITKTNR